MENNGYSSTRAVLDWNDRYEGLRHSAERYSKSAFILSSLRSCLTKVYVNIAILGFIDCTHLDVSGSTFCQTSQPRLTLVQ